MIGPLQAVLFDLDGTLLDTAPDFITALKQLLTQHHQPIPADHIIRQTVSCGANALIKLGFNSNAQHDDFTALRQEFLAIYMNTLSVNTTLFDGINEVLTQLEQHAIPWGIVTNKPSVYTHPLLAALHLNHRSRATICPDHVTHTKPDPEPLLLACKQLHCAPDNVIYVGDHRRDIIAGRRAHMVTVAAEYGYIEPTDPAATWQADHLITHATELLPLIDHYRH